MQETLQEKGAISDYYTANNECISTTVTTTEVQKYHGIIDSFEKLKRKTCLIKLNMKLAGPSGEYEQHS